MIRNNLNTRLFNARGLVRLILALCLFMAAAPGFAGTLITDGSGIVVGIDDLDINGTDYDLSFCDGSFNDIFGQLVAPHNQPEFWLDVNGAQDAAVAIEQALGLVAQTYPGRDNFIVPFGINTTFVRTKNVQSSTLPSIDNGIVQSYRNPAVDLPAPYVVFDGQCPGLIVDGGGLVSGIKGLNVGGQGMDVTFCHSSFNDLFGDVTAPFHTPHYWGSSNDAITAAAAIELALGSTAETAPNNDNFYVPFGQSGSQVNTQNTAPSSSPSVDNGVDQGGRNVATVLSAPFAVFGTSCPGLVYDSAGLVTEIRGVEVLGTEIDLNFCTDSFNNLFGNMTTPSPEPLFWGSSNDARDAAEIIELALGSSAETAWNNDNFYVPFGPSGSRVNTQNTAPSSSPSVDSGVDQGGRSASNVLEAPFMLFGLACP